MLTILIACFATQTWLIYTDDIGYEKSELSEAALQGRKVWLNNNCQSCHQLFGFGGFLGPDLTNRAAQLPLVAFEVILKAGPRQMPAFDLTSEEVSNLHDFLKTMDRSGKAQPKLSDYTASGDQIFSFQHIPWFVY